MITQVELNDAVPSTQYATLVAVTERDVEVMMRMLIFSIDLFLVLRADIQAVVAKN